jgi:hypothetical protein
MADVSSLASQIKDLEYSADLWNSLRIWLTAATAIVAILVFGAMYMANIRAKELANARQLETQLKEEQRQREGEQARKEIEATKASAAQANERTEDLKKENLQLGIELEQEKQARLMIEQRLAARSLSQKERDIISELLKPYPGRKIKITRLGDQEAGPYADQFIEMFKSLGWDVEIEWMGTTSPPIYGINYYIPKEGSDPAIQALTSAFAKARIEVRIFSGGRYDRNHVALFIGLKHHVT